MLTWQILDQRARVTDGCYFITLVHDLSGDVWIARFCLDPRIDPHGVRGDGSRQRGVGHSNDMTTLQTICEDDAHNLGKDRIY